MNVKTTAAVLAPGDSPEVAGALAGRSWARRAWSVLAVGEPGLYAVDFTGVRLATVSWLREGVVGLLRQFETLQGSVLLAANTAELVQEELVVALDACGCVMLAASVSPCLRASNPKLLGKLDSALDEALRAIVECEECDATFLCGKIPRLGLSAANNRLAALEARGVLTSERRGRARIYRPVLEGMSYGN